MQNYEYTHHDDGIHEFVFHKFDRSTIDEHLAFFQNLRQDMAENEPIFYLSDLRDASAPPFRYSVNKARKLNKETPFLENMVIANVLKDGLIGEALRVFINSITRGSKARAFTGENAREEALAWLQEQIANTKTQVKGA